MPIFEYRCDACGKRFETITTRDKADAQVCRHCQSTQTHRLLSTFGVGAAGSQSASPCGEGACPMPAGGGGHVCCGGCQH